MKRSTEHNGRKSKNRVGPKSIYNSIGAVKAYRPNTPFPVRMSSPSYTVIATTAGGVVSPAAQLMDTCRTIPAVQWVDLSNRYNQYIVISMKLHFHPINTVTYAAGGVAAVPFFVAKYTQAVVPTTHAEIVGSSTCKSYSLVGKPFTVEVKRDLSGGTDEGSWTPTTTAIPLDQDANICWSSPVPTGASVNVIIYWIEWIVAFKIDD